MRDRALVLICLTLSMAWVTIAAIYLYPDVKEEFEKHRYLRRIGKLHTPVIPIECPRARGIENQDFIRRTKTRTGAGSISRASAAIIRRSRRPRMLPPRFWRISVKSRRLRTGMARRLVPS